MKIKRFLTAAVATALFAMIAIVAGPRALAYPNVGKLGDEITMTDTVGQVMLSWKVSNL